PNCVRDWVTLSASSRNAIRKTNFACQDGPECNFRCAPSSQNEGATRCARNLTTNQRAIGSFVRRLTLKYGRRYRIECARRGKPLEVIMAGLFDEKRDQQRK